MSVSQRDADTRMGTEAVSLAGKTVLVAHPSAELYGSDRVLLESVRGLREAGAAVVVALPAKGPLVDELLRSGASVEYCVTPVLRKSLLSPRGLFRLVGLTSAGAVSGLRLTHRVRPDAIFVNTLTIPLWVALARLRGIRVICHVHEAEGSASNVIGRLIAAPLLLSNRILANSDYSATVLGRAFRRLGQASVVYNGVPGPSDVSKARREIAGELRVLYLGRLSERKGVDVVIDAVAELHRRGEAARLDVVGAAFTGYEWYEEQLREQVRRLGLESAVHFHGFHNEVWRFLADADVLVVPSRADEPFGNTAVEGLLAARPVIASDTSGLREAAGGYRSSVLVAPSDATALADALSRTAADWCRKREEAWDDQSTATARHSPHLYRLRISRAVAALIGTTTA